MKTREIKITDIWDDEKNKSLSEFIIAQSNSQKPDRKIRNKLLIYSTFPADISK